MMFVVTDTSFHTFFMFYTTILAIDILIQLFFVKIVLRDLTFFLLFPYIKVLITCQTIFRKIQSTKAFLIILYFPPQFQPKNQTLFNMQDLLNKLKSQFIRLITNFILQSEIYQNMEIQLEDYENGRPIVVKTTNQIASKIKLLKAGKKYQEMYELTLSMPNTKQKYLMQANALMHLKRWKQLSQCCDKGLQLDQASDFYNLKGKALGKMEQYHQKIELTKKAIAIEPKVPAYHRNLGAGYYKIKQYDQAIQEHDKAIKYEPKNAINYHNKGAAYFRKKQFDEAKRCFTQAIQLDKKQAISYAWLADSEKQLGNFQKAKQYYERAYELTSNPQYQKQKKAMQEKSKPEKKGFFSKIFG